VFAIPVPESTATGCEGLALYQTSHLILTLPRDRQKVKSKREARRVRAQRAFCLGLFSFYLVNHIEN